MKTSRRFLTFLPVAILAGALCACISTQQTSVRDVPRLRVTFESEKAGHLFYEALSKMPFDDQTETHTHFDIPVVLHVERTVKSGPNEKFNEAVRRCDSNRDGKITEQEAKIFAAQFP